MNWQTLMNICWMFFESWIPTVIHQPTQGLFGQNDLHDEPEEIQDEDTPLHGLLVLEFGVAGLHHLVHADALTHQGSELNEKNQHRVKMFYMINQRNAILINDVICLSSRNIVKNLAKGIIFISSTDKLA